MNSRDSDSLGEALESIRPLVHMFVAKYTMDSDVDDREQDVLMHIASILPEYNRQPRDLNAWLVKIIRHKIIDLWRSTTYVVTDSIDCIDDMIDSEVDGDADCEALDRYGRMMSEWLRIRFPSIPENRVDVVAKIITAHILDGTPIAYCKEELTRELIGIVKQQSKVHTLYDSANVYLRLILYKKGYLVDEYPIPEYSLIPELQLVIGKDIVKILYTLFRGTSIKFKTRR
jgi:hypothetical protein